LQEGQQQWLLKDVSRRAYVKTVEALLLQVLRAGNRVGVASVQTAFSRISGCREGVHQFSLSPDLT
jgi:hypothetical protein